VFVEPWGWEQIDTTVLEVSALNTDVRNAFNKFRALSNVQFMENVCHTTVTPFIFKQIPNSFRACRAGFSLDSNVACSNQDQ
jgi:hypothetical protein